MGVFAASSLLEEAHDIAGHTTQIALAVGRDDTEQPLASLLGKVGFLENALGGVDVWEVERGSGMARIEDCCETHTPVKRPHHDAMHLIVGNVANLAEVDWVNDLIESIFLVTIEILGLATMTCRESQ